MRHFGKLYNAGPLLLQAKTLLDPHPKIVSIADNVTLGRPLSPWTYHNSELFELEYDALFLRRWQFVGHINDVPNPGDFITADIGRDSVVVIRDKDNELRSFLNVCRHRASRVFEGAGNCRGVIRCPYHGWTYKLDGSLMATPQEENFPTLDKTKYSLHSLQLEVFYGLLFVRVKGNGPSLAEQFGDSGHYFEKYDTAGYFQVAGQSTQIWDVNWKVAWDNYLENYHIPIGHPGLHRLVRENNVVDEFNSGVSYGEFEIRDKLSKVAEERRYQELLHVAEERLPEELKGKWVQFGVAPNLGIDIYAEMFDIFQLVPLGPEKTMVRAAFYGPPNPSPMEEELRKLNIGINDSVNDEDKVLCTRVQKGLHSHGYQPGPLALAESSVFNFHEMVRELVPVAALTSEPPVGSVASENAKLLAQESP